VPAGPVDPDSPLRTRRATFTAPGSPGTDFPHRRLLPRLLPTRRSAARPTSWPYRRLVVLVGCRSPAALRPVAGFPDLRLLRRLRRSLRLLGRPSALRIREPPTFMMTDSARRFRRRLSTNPSRSLRNPECRQGSSGLPVGTLLPSKDLTVTGSRKTSKIPSDSLAAPIWRLSLLAAYAGCPLG
jgi:hypothetical protein